MTMDLGLRDKVALVTAGSRGIGAAVAQRLAMEGATVALSSRSAESLERLAKQIADLGGATSTHAVDLADAEATARLVGDVVATHGRLDILVINTPGPRIRPFLETTSQDWVLAHDLLLRPAVELARAGAKQMVGQGGGSIVFLTSTWVKQPATGGVLSASMRSAVSALAKTMALELAPSGVRVNQVMPGATATERMTDIVSAKAETNGTNTDDEISKIVSDIPLKRWADPSEIADIVAFLASPRAGFATGAAWQMDGGAVRSTL
jgi:NAD(P)-dependent dehydrogenase (short-subunit alcohol dehydrogenase family)